MEARELLETRTEAVRLVLTDLVLPEIARKELISECMRGHHPDFRGALHVLAMPAGGDEPQGVVDRVRRFLQKPFHAREMFTK